MSFPAEHGLRHSLIGKLRIISVITALAFLLLSTGIVVAFKVIEVKSIDVMQDDMRHVVHSSSVTRRLSNLFSDIHLLRGTFYRNDSFLESEGERLSAVTGAILQSVKEPRLTARLSEHSRKYQAFLAQCARVNAVLRTEDDIFNDVDRALGELETLIGRLLVDATLQGDDTSFVTQQLTLAVGFRESLLSIAKLKAELDLRIRTSRAWNHDVKILDAVDDLALRLQTISASSPAVARHGRLIESGVRAFKETVSSYFVEIEKFVELTEALHAAELDVLAELENIDSEIAVAAQTTAGQVENIFFWFGLAMITFMVLVIVSIQLTTTRIIKSNIKQPMQSVLAGIEAFSDGKLGKKIAVSRVDEWGVIEKSLNSMASDLQASRADLESANNELERRVRERTEELAKAVNELARSESILLEAQRVAQLGHWSWEVSNEAADWSEELFRIFGLAPSEIDPSYKAFIDRVHPEDRERAEAVFSAVLNDGRRFALDYRVLRAEGEERWVECQGRVVGDQQGRPFKVTGTLLDITERKRIEHLLIEEKERALVTLKSIGDAVISTDAEGRVDYLNPVAEKLTGYLVDEAKGQPLDQVFKIVNEETREKTEDPVRRCLAEGRVVGLANHTILLSRNGEEYAIQDSAAPIQYPTGEIVGVILVFSDVTAARQLSNQVAYQASHDALTGLINRHEFDQRLARVLETAKGSSSENALCYLDLDQFKLVNDMCGHVAGDELLRQISRVFKKNVRYRDSFARLGGDEFGLLIEHCSLEEAEQVALKMIEALSEFEFYWESKRFSIGVSIGLVGVNAFTIDADSVLGAADSACYLAKEQGRNRIHVFREDDEELSKRHGEMQWAVHLPHALEEGKFRLFFQTMAAVDGSQNEGAHYEVLLRLQDDRIVMPEVFFPAADRYNLSSRLDRWVIAETLQWIASHPDHLADLYLCAINLSGHSLNEEGFVAFVQQQLRNHRIPPSKICFEITETAAIGNLSQAASFMRTLNAEGCRFALDDFGSGLSSFAYLKNLPVDFIKIDGIFVKDIAHDSVDLAIVKSINEIATAMGKQTVAEFVENEEILAKLSGIGVTYAQGFGIARPQPIEELLRVS